MVYALYMLFGCHVCPTFRIKPSIGHRSRTLLSTEIGALRRLRFPNPSLDGDDGDGDGDAKAAAVPAAARERGERGRISGTEERTLERKPSKVMLEGYVGVGDGRLGRSTSLTSDDLEDLKGCVDLGFGFSYEDIPKLSSTLPALELCYPRGQPAAQQEGSTNGDSPVASLLVADWKFLAPGDDPKEVKTRIKYWAKAVACIVKLCKD
ncbi:uncharacterized protein LOC141847028 [Curcuma longa]|uniref:uncharacterized protein LOC141847028 n=1 Tax=Curcuma longa TaxID=136217 RepID=UPI003D9F71A2